MRWDREQVLCHAKTDQCYLKVFVPKSSFRKPTVLVRGRKLKRAQAVQAGRPSAAFPLGHRRCESSTLVVGGGTSCPHFLLHPCQLLLSPQAPVSGIFM